MMTRNPFEYDAAPNLPPQQLMAWYIEDHNYARFMRSGRNVIVNGERGSGKSMTLIYHSLTYTRERWPGGQIPDDFDGHVGIYVPCNTPLSWKEEYRLFDEASQARASEANLTFSVLANIAREFSSISELFGDDDKEYLSSEFAFLLDDDGWISAPTCPFAYLSREVHKKLRKTQKDMHKGQWDPTYSLDTFSGLILPILSAIRKTNLLSRIHISLLIDDVQLLNPFQQRLVNSWLGFRDNSIFSIKLAIAGIRSYNFETAYGGAVLDGHDYVSVDLQRPIQNDQSEYGRFAREVIKKRLSNAGIAAAADEFFPVSNSFVRGMEVSKRRAEEIAQERGLLPGTKPFTDYVYKQRRAVYFRDRHAKSNKPTYSGFETLTHLSTGVIRNLLQPCYYMYEQQMAINNGAKPTKIQPEIQDSVVKSHSDRVWEFIEHNLEKRLSSCSTEDGQRILRLFTRLAEYFRDRLLNHQSEPRVVTFIVSGRDDQTWKNVERLLMLAEQAQILYVRSGTSKRGGGRESYYVPNRMLWPRYGLDAHGQHGRASLQASDLWDAAAHNIPLELKRDDLEPDIESDTYEQGSLF